MLARHVVRLLLRHRRHHRQPLAALVLQVRGVADHEDAIRPGELEPCADAHARLRAELRAEPAGEGRRAHARRPDQRARRDHLAAPQHHALAVEASHLGAEADLDVLAPEDLRRHLAQPFRHRAEQPVRRLEQDDANVLHVQVREVLGEHQPDQLREGAGALDPRRPAAHHDEVQHGPAAVGIRLLHRRLEHAEHLVADRDGVLDLLQGEAVLLDGLEPEEVAGAAGREDQPVVGERPGPGAERAAREVDAEHLREAEREVPLAAEDGAHRVGDVLGREPRGGHLVEQRLEQVVVAPVDEGDAQRGAAQRPGGPQAAEPGAHDHDVGELLGHQRKVAAPALPRGD